MKVGGFFEEDAGLGAEDVEAGGLGEGFLPGGGVEDAFFEKVAGEKLTGHCPWIVGVSGVCGVVYPRGGGCASFRGLSELLFTCYISRSVMASSSGMFLVKQTIPASSSISAAQGIAHS